MARTAKLHRLTALTAKRYAEAASQDSPLHDGGGLYLRKRDAAAWWYLRLTEPSSGAQQWHRLFPDDPSGHYPHKSLAEAREEARRLWNLRSSGVDPRQARQQQIQADSAKVEAARIEEERKVTVSALFERWAQTDLQPRLRADGKRVGRKDGGLFTREQFERRVFPVLGKRPVAEVSRGEWLALLDRVKAEGKLRTANVLLADLKQMLRFALARDLIDRNPLETILKRDVGGAAVERDRVLSRGELMGAVWKSPALDMDHLRGQAEADGVKLGVIDLNARTWHLFETKNQRDHTIHLSEFALNRLARLWSLRTPDSRGQACPWVFPNAAANGPVCVKSFGKQLADRQRPPEKRMTGRSRNTTALMLPDGRWTAHDLRRTAATLMAEIGTNGDVIDECLNHIIESKVRRVYIRNRREEAQAVAFDALGAVLAGIVDKAAVT
jgi:integrase